MTDKRGVLGLSAPTITVFAVGLSVQRSTAGPPDTEETQRGIIYYPLA